MDSYGISTVPQLVAGTLIWRSYKLQEILLVFTQTNSMASKYHILHEVNPDADGWKIQVRVIRLWEQHVFNKPGDPFCIEMILMDEKGVRMSAYIKKSLVLKFRDLIYEGKVYSISNFSLSDNNGKYRTATHPYRVNFLGGTRVKEVLKGFPLEASIFEFTEFQAIIDKKIAEEQVIGTNRLYHARLARRFHKLHLTRKRLRKSLSNHHQNNVCIPPTALKMNLARIARQYRKAKLHGRRSARGALPENVEMRMLSVYVRKYHAMLAREERKKTLKRKRQLKEVGEITLIDVPITYESNYFTEMPGPYIARMVSKDYRLKQPRILQGKRKKMDNVVQSQSMEGEYPLHEVFVEYDWNNVINIQNATKPTRDRLSGVSKDYFDFGDPTEECAACGTNLWIMEAERGYKDNHNGKYGICCLHGKDEDGKTFVENIRRYNMMFAFTSMAGKIDHSVNKGHGPYTYRIHGQNYHSHGSLLPTNNNDPKFAQLYVYDTHNEIKFSTTSVATIDCKLIQLLKKILDSTNEFVKSYQAVRDRLIDGEEQLITLRLVANRSTDGRIYNLPSVSKVAMLVVGDVDHFVDKRDIIIETKTGALQRISELHPSYLALQYPLLFPYGDDGYRLGILHKCVEDNASGKRVSLTMREFFAYRLQQRPATYSILLHSRILLQQFIVNAYTMIESERLSFIRNQQMRLRCSTVSKLSESLSQGNPSAHMVGTKIVIPSSFVGGSRYMMHNYLDAMALCKWFGYPDLFLTFTCNPKLPKITRLLKSMNLNPEDIPDIITRVFKMKLDNILVDLKRHHIFGEIRAVVYTIEFQKRGLPHAHVCLFLKQSDKLPTPQDIDRVISAEIPDRELDENLFTLVKEFMMHGPCGLTNKDCPCMHNGRCSRSFPKRKVEQTTVDQNGYPVFRRRDDNRFVEKTWNQIRQWFFCSVQCITIEEV